MKAAVFLGLITADDQSHEFAHAISMEVGRAEGSLLNGPSWREDDKVRDRCPLASRGTCQDREDGRILEKETREAEQERERGA